MKSLLSVVLCGALFGQIDTSSRVESPDYVGNRIRAEQLRRLQLENERIKRALAVTGTEADRIRTLEARLDKVEATLARFIGEESSRWKETNEALDILAQAELKRIEAAKPK